MRVIERTSDTPLIANYRVKTLCGKYYGYFVESPTLAKYVNVETVTYRECGMNRTGWCVVKNNKQVGFLLVESEKGIVMDNGNIVYSLIPSHVIDTTNWADSLVALLPNKLSDVVLQDDTNCIDVHAELEHCKSEIDILRKSIKSAEFALQYKDNIITYLECKNYELRADII